MSAPQVFLPPTRIAPDKMPATGPLADKTIMVTGAAGTIGAAVSHQVAAAGGSVVLLDRQERALDRIYDQIMALGNAPPIQVLQELADLTAETVDLLAGQLSEEFGKLDGLVHAAGEPPRLTPLEHLDPGHWSRLISVQLHAPYLLTRGLLPLLRQAPQASVIFTLWHRLGHLPAYWGATGVTSASLQALAEIWNEETEANTEIMFFTVEPGPVASSARAQACPGEDPTTLASPETAASGYLDLLLKPASGVRAGVRPGAAPST